MYRGHPNIITTYRGHPNICGIKCMGVSKHTGGIQTQEVHNKQGHPKHMGCSNIWGLANIQGTSKLMQASKCMGAYVNPLSLTKHAFFMLCMCRGYPSIIKTYRGYPNIQEGVQTYGGVQTYRGHPNMQGGVQTYRGHPNMGDVQTYRGIRTCRGV